ncbi:Ribosomal L1 domain-containing protein 1 [Linum grandiflorum]
MVTPPPGAGVGPETVERAVNALLGWRAANKKTEKAQLLEQDEFVYVVVSLKKIPEKGVSRIKPYKVQLPHHLVNSQDGSSELCLIIDDRSKSGLTKEDAKKKIDNDGIPISKIIKLSKLKTDYKAFEAKRKLCDSYDFFLADRRVMPLLPKMLGKEFFRKKKIPVSIDLKHKNWKEQIDSACGSALVFVGTGTCAVVKAARLSMEKDEISENVMATVNGVVQKVVPKKWGGVRSLHLKLLDSLALPLYETVPELKLKIQSKKVPVEEEEEKEKEKEEENVEDPEIGKKNNKKKKGRISEVRYMDSKGDAADNEEVEKDAALVTDGDEEAEMASAEVVVKKRKKGVKGQDETRAKKVAKVLKSGDGIKEKKGVGKGTDEKLKKKKKKASE